MRKKFSDKGILHANLVGTYINTEYGYTFITAKDIELQEKINKYSYFSAGNRYDLIEEGFLQRDAMDCGSTCLGMVAGHYGRHPDRDMLRELCDLCEVKKYSVCTHLGLNTFPCVP